MPIAFDRIGVEKELTLDCCKMDEVTHPKVLPLGFLVHRPSWIQSSFCLISSNDKNENPYFSQSRKAGEIGFTSAVVCILIGWRVVETFVCTVLRSFGSFRTDTQMCEINFGRGGIQDFAQEGRANVQSTRQKYFLSMHVIFLFAVDLVLYNTTILECWASQLTNKLTLIHAGTE